MDEIIKSELQRIHDEDNRQNHRLDNLEETVKEQGDLILSIQRLTLSLETLTKTVEKQGQDIKQIKEAPLTRIDSAKQTALNTIIGIIIGAMAAGLIQMIAQNVG